jgi:hypothetical protein
VNYKLLDEFRALFDGTIYRHRSSTNGDRVAHGLYEDMLALGRSPKYVAGVSTGTRVVNAANKATGIAARRGDGSFGELLPHVPPLALPGYSVRRGPIANIEIGVETKILATAIGKQVQERISSLIEQAQVFRHRNANCICVAIVGLNYAPSYLAYEGERTTATDGAKYPHPIQQAATAEAKVRAELKGVFEEVVILPFVATNQDPFAFSWANTTAVANEYGAALLRISQEYERRF